MKKCSNRKSIVILTAMPQEVEVYKEYFDSDSIKEENTGLLDVTRGTIQGYSTILVKTGMCKTNAAIASQHLIDHYDPLAVIMSGTAGGLQPYLEKSDVVVAESAAHHDIFVPIPAYQGRRGEIPEFRVSGNKRPRDLWFKSDEYLKKTALNLGTLYSNQFKIHEGKIISGEYFATDDQKKELLRHFPGAAAIDMEYAAVAQTVCRNNAARGRGNNAKDAIGVLGVKGIPDTLGSPAETDFDLYLDKSAKHAAHLVASLIEKISHDDTFSIASR